MDQLSGVNILIVENDPSTSSNLRMKLARHGASVRVVSSFKAALVMLKRNRIDVAFVPFEHSDQSGDLRDMLKERGVPQIITAMPPASSPNRFAKQNVVATPLIAMN